MSEIDKRIYEKYNIKVILGVGACGIVWKAQDKQSKHIVAIKNNFDAIINQIDAQSTFREVWLLQHLNNHPNILKILILERTSNGKGIYFIFECLDMDLDFAIIKKKLKTNSQKKIILCQVFLALTYIHSADVLHRDMKPSNIRLNEKCQVKVADFGLVRSLIQLTENVSESVLTEKIGALWYRAPELLLEANTYTNAIVIWSVFCILRALFLEAPLFQGSSSISQLKKIKIALSNPVSTLNLSSGYASAILEKTSIKPKPLLLEIFLQDSKETIGFLSQLLTLNPKSRLSAEQAIDHPYLSINKIHNSVKPLKCLPAMPPYNDYIRFTIEEYRDKLYQMIRECPGYGNNPDTELEKKYLSSV